MQPPPDAVSEFRVVTNNQSAEYGRAAGATVNVAYRSGANQFHGDGWEFFRDTALNAMDRDAGAAVAAAMPIATAVIPRGATSFWIFTLTPSLCRRCVLRERYLGGCVSERNLVRSRVA